MSTFNKTFDTIVDTVKQFNPFVGFKDSFLSVLNKDTSLNDNEKRQIQEKFNKLENEEINILMIGGTGVGKSSTVNALFETGGDPDWKRKAVVGYGPDPETQSINRYPFGNLIIWDSPGVGESPVADVLHTRAIVAKLNETDADQKPLIDMVLVVLDGGTRDYGSVFQLLRIISPIVKDSSRFVVGINKVDNIYCGRFWDEQKNIPQSKLKKAIDIKIENVKKRLIECVGLNTTPIGYCAGSLDELCLRYPYNVSELLCQIIVNIPDHKRIAILKKAKQDVIRKSTTAQKEAIRKTTERTLRKQSSGDKTTSALVRVGLCALTGGLFGGCFITTAVCYDRGKADDCHMLQTFRSYRDNWLIDQPGGKYLIQVYYDVAPELVEWMSIRDDKKLIYDWLYFKFLRPCYRMIKKR